MPHLMLHTVSHSWNFGLVCFPLHAPKGYIWKLMNLCLYNYKFEIEQIGVWWTNNIFKIFRARSSEKILSVKSKDMKSKIVFFVRVDMEWNISFLIVKIIVLELSSIGTGRCLLNLSKGRRRSINNVDEDNITSSCINNTEWRIFDNILPAIEWNSTSRKKKRRKNSVDSSVSELNYSSRKYVLVISVVKPGNCLNSSSLLEIILQHSGSNEVTCLFSIETQTDFTF